MEIVASNTAENLLARDADIAIRMFQSMQQALITCKVNELSLGAYASEADFDHFGRPSDLEQLMQHRLVGHDRDEVVIKGGLLNTASNKIAIRISVSFIVKKLTVVDQRIACLIGG